MPTYELRCRSCGTSIEQTMHVEEYEKARGEHGFECPKCKSKDLAPQIGPFEVKTSRKAS